jgi:hypothetical protein
MVIQCSLSLTHSLTLTCCYCQELCNSLEQAACAYVDTVLLEALISESDLQHKLQYYLFLLYRTTLQFDNAFRVTLVSNAVQHLITCTTKTSSSKYVDNALDAQSLATCLVVG